MNNTSHYGLKKPEAADFYDVDDFNYNADKIDAAIYGKQDRAKLVSISIAITDWSENSCVKTVLGVTSDNTVMVSPFPDSIDAYAAAEVRCVAQATDALTFTCKKIPTSALNIDIMIDVSIAQALEIDKTLTISDAAADAKVVGDALSAISSGINELGLSVVDGQLCTTYTPEE